MPEEKTDKKVDQILDILQKMFIVEAHKNGLSSEQVRKILGINNNEISKIWKHIKNSK